MYHFFQKDFGPFTFQTPNRRLQSQLMILIDMEQMFNYNLTPSFSFSVVFTLYSWNNREPNMPTEKSLCFMTHVKLHDSYWKWHDGSLTANCYGNVTILRKKQILVFVMIKRCWYLMKSRYVVTTKIITYCSYTEQVWYQ